PSTQTTSASVLMRMTASPRSALPSKKAVTSSIPSMNTKLRTRENWLARACTSCRVKRAKLATEPEMSATTMISGLDGWGRRKRGPGGQLRPGEALLQLVGEPAALGGDLLHEPVEEAVEVEGPQRPIQVVGAAHRPARLHPGVAGDGGGGEAAQGVGVEDGPHEHGGQCLGGGVATGPAAGHRPGDRHTTARPAARPVL